VGIAAAAAAATGLFKDDNVGLFALGNRHHTEGGASGSNGGATDHLVDRVHRGVDLAWKAVATAALALDLDTKVWDDVAEGRGGLQIDGVPSDLHERVAVSVGVCAGNIRRPVTEGAGRSTPDTSGLGVMARRVDIEADNGQYETRVSWPNALTERRFHTSS
jgi:hypothetical protein